MRISNGRAIRYLLTSGYDQVYLKAHTKWTDTIYSVTGNYKALDLFNLWDGIALHPDGIVFIQIKTNAWPKEQPIIDWCTKYNAKGLAINVKLINDDWAVLVRSY